MHRRQFRGTCSVAGSLRSRRSLVGSKRGSRFFGENRTNTLANDASSPDCNIHTPTTSVFASAGIPWLGFGPVFGFSSIAGFPVRKASTIWSVGDASDLRVEAYEEMWNVVGDLRQRCFRSDKWDALHGSGDKIDPLLVVALHRLFRVRENPVDRRDHPHNLFLLATFMPRPIPSHGLLFSCARSVRLFLPRRRPAFCGPRIPLPPENVTRSKPMPVYFHRFEIGSISAAASRRHGILYSCATRSHSSRPICALPAIPSSFFRSVEEIRHHRVACAARAPIVFKRDNLRHARAAEIYGAVILIEVRTLHDNLILPAAKSCGISKIFALFAYWMQAAAARLMAPAAPEVTTAPSQLRRRAMYSPAFCCRSCSRTGWSAAFCTAARTWGACRLCLGWYRCRRH